MLAKFLLDAERWSHAISKPTAIIGVVGLLAAALMTIVNVLARWLLGTPLIFVNDLFGLIVILVVASTFPTGVLQRKHVAIEFFGTWLGRHASRVLDSLGALATAVFLAVVAWQVTVVAIAKSAEHDFTYVLRMPTAPFWWLAAALLWISVPMQLVVFGLRLLDIGDNRKGDARHE